MKPIARGDIKITQRLTVYQTAQSMYCWVWWHKPGSGKNTPSCYYEVRYADIAWKEIANMTAHNLGALRSILTATYGGVVVELNHVGTAGAAAILGRAQSTIRNQVIAGRLTATMVARDHLIAVDEVARYALENRSESINGNRE